jgi:hypothetical protein
VILVPQEQQVILVPQAQQVQQGKVEPLVPQEQLPINLLSSQLQMILSHLQTQLLKYQQMIPLMLLQLKRVIILRFYHLLPL